MAKNFNVVTIIGQATSDVELKSTSNGKAVADFSIANNRDFGETKRVNFIRCRAYGPLAEKVIVPYVKKGTKVLVNGELCVDQYEKDGKTTSYTYVLVTDIELLSAKKAEESTSNTAPSFSPYDGF